MTVSVDSNPAAFPANLTPREVDAVQAYIAHGSYKGAAVELGLAVSTVMDMLKAARKKAGVRCGVHLAVAFVRATEVRAS